MIRSIENNAIAAAVDSQPSTLDTLNPELSRLMNENPGLKVLVQKWEATGAIMQSKPGYVASKATFAMWSHSKQSGGMPVEPFKDIVVAWQNDPEGRNVDLGIGGYSGIKGKIVGVYRLDQFAFATEAEARKFNPTLPKVNSIEPGKFVHISDDTTFRGSYEWNNMSVPFMGPKGSPVDLNWAVVSVGTGGQILGGGYPGGWGGRTARGTAGTDLVMKMPNH